MLKIESKGGEEEGVNLMPLIDVIFILLIFFMITARFQPSSLPLNLPRAESGVKEDSPLVLTIGVDKTMDLDGTAVSEETLEDVLEARLRSEGKLKLTLACDRDLPFGFVVTVLDRAKKVGIEDIGIRYEATSH
ncbi:MAG: biopolymer transporter ExbD [Spirochaetales bacterium]|nr:biopolymer transporter ExbD [Spirochaetales bacterium]